MKALILQGILDLIDSKNKNERERLAAALIENISLASLDLNDEKAGHVKKLIITTIKGYVEFSDDSLRKALLAHYDTLNKLIFNFC